PGSKPLTFEFDGVCAHPLSAIAIHMKRPSHESEYACCFDGAISFFVFVLKTVLREGLAVAGDPSFKTFEATFPYVVRKLLSDNSVASRKILHSVVLNRKKEFQWQKLALFLRVAATRKGLNTIMAPNPQASLAYLNSIKATNPQASLAYSSNAGAMVWTVANLVLRILPSKDGIVLRRLLMTADGASLVRAFVSEAKFFSSTPFWDYGCKSILRDRRLKLILFNVLGSARKHPILWTFLLFMSVFCQSISFGLSSVLLEKLSDKQCQPESQLKFIIKAWLQIVECRRVLKWTYAYGYYLPEHEHAKRQFFEYLQGFALSSLFLYDQRDQSARERGYSSFGETKSSLLPIEPSVRGPSSTCLVDHLFLRFRTTTQVIRELLRRSFSNRIEIVRQFGSLDPSAALEKGRGVEIVEPEK
ncbi:hypothetical protein HAX54_007833, partial [Datura stramonium]|nr:hypothetical protein [Datura stramonium]